MPGGVPGGQEERWVAGRSIGRSAQWPGGALGGQEERRVAKRLLADGGSSRSCTCGTVRVSFPRPSYRNSTSLIEENLHRFKS